MSSRLAFVAMAASVLAVLAACSGTEPTPPERQLQSRLHVPALAPDYGTLLDDDGQPMPPHAAAVPTDPAAHTRMGRYALKAQAAQLVDALGSAAIEVHVQAGEPTQATERAVQAVLKQVSRRGLGLDAPTLVHGADPAVAAAVVDALGAFGFSHVFLVTP